jgi:hypothetical protein
VCDCWAAFGTDTEIGLRRPRQRVGSTAQTEPETGIIPDEELTKAAGSENSALAVAEKFLATEDEGGEDEGGEDGAREWYGDSAYGTGDLRGAIDDAGHDAVIKPKPLQAPVEGGFTVDDFTVDEEAGTVGCPAGHTRPISRTRVASFGALCGGCPLRERCTKSKTGRKIVLPPTRCSAPRCPPRLGRRP